jgi:hypothetical protein
MMGRRRLYVLVAATFVAVGAAAYAIAGPGDLHALKDPPNSKHFKATLSGYQENPSISTTGHGEFRAELNKDGDSLHYVLQYAGLEAGGTTSAAHVHVGARYTNGGVSFFFCGGGTKPTPCPNGEATLEGDVTAADISGPSGQGVEALSFDEIIKMMQAGHAYANVHTTPRWPGGEIRGQINNEDQKQFEG